MIEITDFSSHIIKLEKKIDKTGGHQTSQERLFYFCAQPTSPAIGYGQLFLSTTTYYYLLTLGMRRGFFPCREGVYESIERKAPAFSDQTIPHTSPIMLNDKSTIYIDHIEIFHACGAKNFVP